MYKIAKIIETCGGCPSQWSARTSEGNYVYIRYRWGCLSVRIDKLFGEGYEYENSWNCGDGLDGVMCFSELEEHTAGVLDFSDAKWVEDRDEI